MMLHARAISAIFLIVSVCAGFANMAAATDAGGSKPPVYRISGPITADTLAGLLLQVKPAMAAGSIVLELDSPGGEMAPARIMADLLGHLSERGMAVHTDIGPGSRCLSACVLIYAAGEVRTAAATASIGLHGVRDGRSGEVDGAAGRRLAGYLGSRGVAKGWLSRLEDDGVFDRLTMTAFTGNDLVTTGLAHSIYN